MASCATVAEVIELMEGHDLRFLENAMLMFADKGGDSVIIDAAKEVGPALFFSLVIITLSFLPEGENFVAEIYADGEGAHWLTNPLPVDISTLPVDAGSSLTLALAPGGGQGAAHLDRPLTLLLDADIALGDGLLPALRRRQPHTLLLRIGST